MKVLIPCGGTRGDTQPCVALAVRLRSEGHSCLFFAPTTHLKLITDQGFHAIEVDFDMEAYVEEILASSDMKRFGAGLGFLKKTMDFLNKPDVKEKARNILPELWKVAQEFKPDLIMCAEVIPCLGICAKLKIPYSKSFPSFCFNMFY